MRLHMGLVYQFRRRFKVLYALDPGWGESRFSRGEKKARAKRASMTEGLLGGAGGGVLSKTKEKRGKERREKKGRQRAKKRMMCYYLLT